MKGPSVTDSRGRAPGAAPGSALDPPGEVGRSDLMFDVCKTKALRLKTVSSTRIRERMERVSFARVGRWLPATALLVVAGCSWFDEEPTPPAPSEQAKATAPAPGEGETMAGEEQEAKIPDINSVPN